MAGNPKTMKKRNLRHFLKVLVMECNVKQTYTTLLNIEFFFILYGRLIAPLRQIILTLLL